MTGGGTRPRGGRVSEQQPPPPPDPLETLPEDSGGLGPESRPQLSLAERYGLAQKAAGIAAPLLTALLAFLIGGVVVVITTRQHPLERLPGDLRRLGPNWFFPGSRTDRRGRSRRSTSSRR